jgi:ribosomal protein S18 acetylase RimI-like enzyme
MAAEIRMLDVTPDTVERSGFFCYRSKRRSEGYRLKRAWLDRRFEEGLRLRILQVDGTPAGFIEYLPGEHAWRAVHAAGTMAIHCIWVVGRHKGQGLAARLLDACLEDAEREGLDGVTMVASSGHWLAGRALFERHGFVAVDVAPPSFELLATDAAAATGPSFPTDWEARRSAFGDALTVVRTDQCPYLEDATRTVLAVGERLGLATDVVELDSAEAVRAASPSPYGVFGIVFHGRLLSYHYELEKDLVRMLEAA